MSGEGPRRDRGSDDDAERGDASGESAAADEDDAPLSDLRRDVDERRDREDDDFEELFAEMEVGDVDEAEVWAALDESADEPVVDPGVVTDAVGEPADDDGETTVVEKSLCHGCPHFADPPETACTHDGTTIEAEVDTGHFRVRDCPVVAEREARDPGDFSPDPE
ncbi:hypothetical protein [Halobacterium jilantaiense]|uniref:DUF8135 domain-containing protein n=1 Tax=Halobacterium jilantaiense TaxID=355548 RepID=A0A1I0QCJ4_9EURY|nr:hypothetical protein [Halobacterium jilantaiense]SEW24779.1 hypothetical protein SAMN04487945_2485 [Halobacterium jilantaiense]